MRQLPAVCVLKGLLFSWRIWFASWISPSPSIFSGPHPMVIQWSRVVRQKLDLDLQQSISNRHVLLVEDIVDTGLTLKYLQSNLESRNRPRSASALCQDKPANNVKLSSSIIVASRFPILVVGYGLIGRVTTGTCLTSPSSPDQQLGLLSVLSSDPITVESIYRVVLGIP